MIVLVVGLAIFIGVHLFREFGIRAHLVDKQGEPRYKGIFSLLALTGLGLIIYGKSIAPFLTIWVPAYELRSVTHLLMLPAWILVMAGNLPHSIIKSTVSHPMLLGVIVWGCSHLLANGDLASLLLFGSLVLFSTVKIVTAQKTDKTAIKPASLKWDFVAIVSGFVLYGIVLVFHGQLFGVGLSLTS